MIVKETSFMVFSHLKDLDIVKVDWQAASESMSDDDFKEQITLEKEVFLAHRPKGVLGQTQNLKFSIKPDLQEWHNTQIMPIFKEIGLRKLAVVVSQDFFTEVSVSQLIEDDEQRSYQTQYFPNEVEAIEWLKES